MIGSTTIISRTVAVITATSFVIARCGSVHSNDLSLEESNYICLVFDCGESGRGKRGGIDLGGLEFEVNAEVADHFLNVLLGSSTRSDIICPGGVDRQGIKFNNVAKSSRRKNATKSGKVSFCGEDADSIRGERLVFTLRN
jgi:hypothetical protein